MSQVVYRASRRSILVQASDDAVTNLLVDVYASIQTHASAVARSHLSFFAALTPIQKRPSIRKVAQPEIEVTVRRAPKPLFEISFANDTVKLAVSQARTLNGHNATNREPLQAALNNPAT